MEIPSPTNGSSGGQIVYPFIAKRGQAARSLRSISSVSWPWRYLPLCYSASVWPLSAVRAYR